MVRAVKRVLSKVAHSLIPPRFCQPWFTSCKLSSFIFWQGGILPFLSPSICSCRLWIACRNTGRKEKKKSVWVVCKWLLFIRLTAPYGRHGAHYLLQRGSNRQGQVFKLKGKFGVYCRFVIPQKWKSWRCIRYRGIQWQRLCSGELRWGYLRSNYLQQEIRGRRLQYGSL